MLNQPNSTGDTEAGYCSVCKNGLLNKAAFKGHVFAASVSYKILIEGTGLQTVYVNSSQTSNSTVIYAVNLRGLTFWLEIGV